MGKQKKRRGSSFKGKVAQNTQKQKSQGASYAHLRLPKGVSVFSPDVTTRVRLDFLPYEVTSPTHLDRDDEYGIAVPGELWYKKPYYRHRDIGPNNDSVVCPSTDKKKCPICEYRAKLMKEGAAWDDETVKALRPSLRNLYVVVPRGSKDYAERPHIFDISQFCFQQQLNEEIDEDEANAVFPDPDEGLTVKVRFSEASIGKTKFPEASRIDFSPRAKPISDKMLAASPNLDEMLVIPSYASLEAMFFGGLDKEAADAEVEDDDWDEDSYDDEGVSDDDDWDDEDEVEAPAPKKGKAKPASKKPAPEPDDDDDWDDGESDDDEDEDWEDEGDEDIGDDDSDEGDYYEDDDGVEDGWEDEDLPIPAPSKPKRKPAPAPKAKSAPKAKPVAIEDDDDDWDDEDDEDEVEAPAPKTKGKAKAASAPKKPAAKATPKKGKAKAEVAEGECPHGHTFGEDCEEYDECDTCDVWEECFDAKG